MQPQPHLYLGKKSFASLPQVQVALIMWLNVLSLDKMSITTTCSYAIVSSSLKLWCQCRFQWCQCNSFQNVSTSNYFLNLVLVTLLFVYFSFSQCVKFGFSAIITIPFGYFWLWFLFEFSFLLIEDDVDDDLLDDERGIVATDDISNSLPKNEDDDNGDDNEDDDEEDLLTVATCSRRW